MALGICLLRPIFSRYPGDLYVLSGGHTASSRWRAPVSMGEAGVGRESIDVGYSFIYTRVSHSCVFQVNGAITSFPSTRKTGGVTGASLVPHSIIRHIRLYGPSHCEYIEISPPQKAGHRRT